MRSTIEGCLFIVNWALVACAAVALLIMLATTGFTIRFSPHPAAITLMMIAIILGPLSAILLWNGTARWPKASHAAAALSQIVLATALIAPATYIAASANYPLLDHTLHLIDSSLGLDWKAYLAFTNDHRLGQISRFGYLMISWQPLAIPIILGLTGNIVRGYQFVAAYILAAVITVAVSAVLPAVGTYTYFGLTPADYPNLHPIDDFVHVHDFTLLRQGKLQLVDLAQMQGIITFPSFHAASGILFLWAFWAVWWMRPVAIICNGLLLLSTPIYGGHYFIDVIAGIVIACCAIVAAVKFTKSLQRGTHRNNRFAAPSRPSEQQT